MEREIYLEGAANVPVDKRVFRAMKPFLRHSFKGNASAIHGYGQRAAKAIADARKKIASIVDARPEEVYFTSGATEGNNWVITSLAMHEMLPSNKNPKKHIVCSSIEHSSIINTCKYFIPFGFDVTFVDPDINGVVTAESIGKALRPDTLLVCIMAVNNETGKLCEARESAELAKKNGSLTLIDCTQLIGYGGKNTHICSNYLQGDYFTFSAHKFYGPEGVGCLIARSGVPLYPLLHGGSQEFGKRSGTSNVAGIVGMAKALELVEKDTNLSTHFNNLYIYLIIRLIKFATKLGIVKGTSMYYKSLEGFLSTVLNTAPDHRNIVSLNLSPFIRVDGLQDKMSFKGIAVSAGSACDAGHDNINGFNPSHVLVAMGLSEDAIRNTIRVSFTKDTTKRDIDRLIGAIGKIMKEQKEEQKEFERYARDN